MGKRFTEARRVLWESRLWRGIGCKMFCNKEIDDGTVLADVGNYSGAE